MKYLTEGDMRGFMKKIAMYNINEDYQRNPKLASKLGL